MRLFRRRFHLPVRICRVLSICLSGLLVASSCSDAGQAPRAATITKSCSIGPRPGSTQHVTSHAPTLPTNGPLRTYNPGDTIGGSGWFPSEDFVSFRTDVPLENTWAKPVTVDSVVVGPPMNPKDSAPRLLACFAVMTPAQYREVSNWNDLKGHIPILPQAQGLLVPHSSRMGFSPSLALLFAPNGPISYTSYVVVAYHTSTGQEYTAVFNQVWLLCVKGEAPSTCPDLLQHLP